VASPRLRRDTVASPAAIILKRFGHFNGAIKRDGVALGNIVSADLTYANNLDRIETIRSDAKIDGADPTIAALTGKIEVRFITPMGEEMQRFDAIPKPLRRLQVLQRPHSHPVVSNLLDEIEKVLVPTAISAHREL
jgi:hypothetical protein